MRPDRSERRAAASVNLAEGRVDEQPAVVLAWPSWSPEVEACYLFTLGLSSAFRSPRTYCIPASTCSSSSLCA